MALIRKDTNVSVHPTDDINRLNAASDALLSWYAVHKRALPWRDPIDPYHTWISEIMLQQTRIDVVIGYYHRFLTLFPNIKALADAPEDALLKAWEGLGYYSRVRNIAKAARMITDDYAGLFPRTKKELMKLPGIGDYTAAAIASIVFGEPVPSVDGNVLRVCARILNDDRDVLLGATRKDVTALLDQVIPHETPGDFNQAFMELGETVCLPEKSADCARCPVNHLCLSYAHGTVCDLPVRNIRTKKTTEKLTVFLITAPDGLIAIGKRPDTGLLAGLYEFPNTSGHLTKKEAESWLSSCGYSLVKLSALPAREHIFTHKKWLMKAYRVQINAPEKMDEPYQFVHPSLLDTDYSIPGAFSKFKPFI